MLNPLTTQADFINIANKNADTSEAKEKLIEDTTYKQQVVDMDVNFSTGSIKITEEIASLAKLAVESRMAGVKDYTKERIDRVNVNLQQYNNEIASATDGKSLAQVFFPETFNAVEDWSDDLYLMFQNMIDELSVEDVGDNVEKYISKVLEITEVEDEKKLGFVRSLARFLFKQENTAETDNYHFRKNDIIKSFLKRGLHRSKYTTKVEAFLTSGINSGMFVLKDDWGPTGEYKLSKGKDGDTGGNFKYELDQEDVYLFNPVDSRLMIFPKYFNKHGAFPWVIEKIPTTFHELLNEVLDENGEPKEDAKYDVAMLKKLGKYLKDVGANKIKAKDHTLEAQDNDYDTQDSDINDLWDIDGNITIYEAHAIPLLIKKGGNKLPYKYMISMVNLSEAEDEPDMLAIGIQKTPYVAGNPYLTCNFVQKDGDVSGIGLPELVRPLQKMLNNFTGHSVDILNIALWGIMVIDPDVFKDTTKLKQITPRLLLKLKNMKGRKVDDVVQWMHPKLDTLGAMGDMFSLFQQALKRTTRKGPTGEKISPNPSATEFESLVAEMQKSVNKVGLRVNNLFVRMLERMYIYNILNMKERIKLNAQAFRIQKGGQKKDKKFSFEEEVEKSSYSMIDKSVELTPEELFVDGLNFKMSAADTFNKKAVEKQQSMQITKMLFETGAILNPQTGEPHMMKDETGAPVFISEYKLYKRLLEFFDYDDVFDKPEQSAGQQEQSPQAQQGQPQAPQAPQGSVSAPNLTASPEASAVAQQASTLSQGAVV